jgi:hypothetical protein
VVELERCEWEEQKYKFAISMALHCFVDLVCLKSIFSRPTNEG